MSRVRARAVRDERGQVLVMAVMFMAVLLGAAALTLDIGRMAVTRRYLQNTADSSALAGAWSLPTSSGAAVEAATEWATDADKYALSMSELSNVEVQQTSAPNDTVRVDVRRSVPWIFARVLGLNSRDISATATAQLRVLNGITAGRSRAFPYAVWDGNKNKVQLGDTVVFHSNNYEARNVDDNVNCTKNKKNPPPGCTWDVDGNNFKGYFHWQNGYNYYVEPTAQAFSQGGNALGTSDYEEMMKYYQAGVPVLLPVINDARNPSGNRLDFVITSFVCVRITQFGNSSVDWAGVILPKSGCAADGLYDGTNPPALQNAYVPILIK